MSALLPAAIEKAPIEAMPAKAVADTLPAKAVIEIRPRERITDIAQLPAIESSRNIGPPAGAV